LSARRQYDLRVGLIKDRREVLIAAIRVPGRINHAANDLLQDLVRVRKEVAQLNDHKKKSKKIRGQKKKKGSSKGPPFTTQQKKQAQKKKNHTEGENDCRDETLLIVRKLKRTGSQSPEKNL